VAIPAPERAILVGLEVRSRAARRNQVNSDLPEVDADESLEELAVLTESAGGEVVDRSVQMREAPDAATLVGSGKVEELARKVKALEADVVVFDRDLSPTQQRNLERELDSKVVDRTQLILDIFAGRARTREGQLQVELAQLNYLLPRLAGRGTQMSRLGGGIGTRGPGETQLETDRRRINRRIRNIEEDLEKVRSTRSIQRKQRQSVPLATVGLVGYTNAGKSTLFNRLAQADVLADPKMFATLDPTVRQYILPSQRKVLLSDTVGFIRNLPTTLVKAFRATLEEVGEASILLHVVDAASPQAPDHARHVLQVLREIDAHATPQILVLNKMDLIEADADASLIAQRIIGTSLPEGTVPNAVAVSARTGAGVPQLVERIDQLLRLDPLATIRLKIPHLDGATIHLVHERTRVLEKIENETEVDFLVEAPESVRKFLARFAQS
jgi:GTPase